MSDAKARLKEIIDAYVERDGGAGIDTGIVASHIAQMKLFGVRQGVEFFPSQDNFGNQRKDFIDKVVKYNKLDTRLDSIWDYFLCDGKGLFYIRPTENNYRLLLISVAMSIALTTTSNGELEEVVIIYSYKVKKPKLWFPRYRHLQPNWRSQSNSRTKTLYSFINQSQYY